MRIINGPVAIIFFIFALVVFATNDFALIAVVVVIGGPIMEYIVE